MEVIASQSLKSYHVACSIKYITFCKILINPICRYLYLRSSYWRVTSPNSVKTTIIKILWFVFLFISYFSPVSFFLLSRNPYCCIRTSLQTHSVERSSGRANSIPRILHRSNKGGSDASYESVTLGRDTGHGITERATRKQKRTINGSRELPPCRLPSTIRLQYMFVWRVANAVARETVRESFTTVVWRFIPHQWTTSFPADYESIFRFTI